MSRPKPRRKKPIEPLDWRELAEGPALRGLAEVLSTSAEVARERASRRAEAAGTASSLVLPAEGGSTTVVETPTAGERPTVGVSPTVDESPAPILRGAVGDEAIPRRPTVAETPTAGGTPAVGVSPSAHTAVASQVGEGGSSPSPNALAPTMPALKRTPTVGEAPTVGVNASVVESPSNAAAGVTPTVGVTPGQVGWWVDAAGIRYEAKRVQSVHNPQQSMSLGEERVYQTLWQGRESDGVYVESERSKTFSLGYDRIARLVRLNEKSVRLLLPKLIHKKILEVVAAENSADRIGRTYRIFNDEAILDRQRAANLTNVVKRGRAVEFVWPERGP